MHETKEWLKEQRQSVQDAVHKEFPTWQAEDNLVMDAKVFRFACGVMGGEVVREAFKAVQAGNPTPEQQQIVDKCTARGEVVRGAFEAVEEGNPTPEQQQIVDKCTAGRERLRQAVQTAHEAVKRGTATSAQQALVDKRYAGSISGGMKHAAMTGGTGKSGYIGVHHVTIKGAPYFQTQFDDRRLPVRFVTQGYSATGGPEAAAVTFDMLALVYRVDASAELPRTNFEPSSYCAGIGLEKLRMFHTAAQAAHDAQKCWPKPACGSVELLSGYIKTAGDGQCNEAAPSHALSAVRVPETLTTAGISASRSSARLSAL